MLLTIKDRLWKLPALLNSFLWGSIIVWLTLRETDTEKYGKQYIILFLYLTVCYVLFHILTWAILQILTRSRKTNIAYIFSNFITTLVYISNYIFVLIFGKQLGLEGIIMMVRGWMAGELGDFTYQMFQIFSAFFAYLILFYLVYLVIGYIFPRYLLKTSGFLIFAGLLAIPVPFLHAHLVSLTKQSWKANRFKYTIPWQSITGFPEDRVMSSVITNEGRKLPAYFLNPPGNPETLELQNALVLKDKIPQILEFKLKVQRPYNILFINVEGLRYDMLTSYHTPNLYKFASSRAKILKKHYTTGNNTPGGLIGMLTGFSPFYFEPLRQNEVPNLPLEILKKLGYRQSVYYNSPKYYEYIYRDFLERTEGKFVKVPGRTEDYASREKELIQMYLQELRKDKSSLPRFDYYLVNTTHFNYYYPPEFEIHTPAFTMDFQIISGRQEEFEKHKKALMNRYLNSILYFDYLFGEWIRELENLGRLNNTIIVIAGDHGEEFWEHGSFGHTWGLNNKQIQTAAVIYYPGIRQEEIQYTYTSHSDFLPTVFEILGLNFPSDIFMTGKSLISYDPQKDYSISSLGVLISFKRNDYAIIGNGLKILFKNNLNLNRAPYAIFTDWDEEISDPEPQAVTDLLKKIPESKKIRISEGWEFSAQGKAR